MIVVQVAGRLGKDPESRFTPSGQKVTTLTLATNVRKGGKEETVWWRVTIWGERFDKMVPHFKKGTALVVIGNMQKPDIWTDKEGRPQVSLDLTAEMIHFSPFGGSNSERPQEGAAGNQTGAPASNYSSSNSGYTAYQSNAAYGSDNGDFGGMTQGAGTRNTSSDFAEEQPPF